jgi:hypothetical protein
VPAGLRLLGLAAGLLDEAVAVDALRSGQNLDRAVVLIASTTGVLLTSGLARWDDSWFDGRRLAQGLVRDLFIAWGAAPDDLDRVEGLIATMAEHGHLVPAVRR